MKMMIIMAGAAFVVSLAGGAAVRIMTAPAPVAATASMEGHAAEDSVHAGTPHDSSADPAPPAGHEADGLHAGPVQEVPPASEHTAEEPAAAPAPASESVQSDATPPPAENMREGMEQLSKILGSMKASDAARILAYLQDEHVEGILQSMSVRQAATILPQLPPERAARLSRRLIENPKQEAP